MIIDQPPIIYKRLRKEFHVSWEDGVIITYFPHIYWRGGDQLPQEKVAHEKVHLRQQEKLTPEVWWDRFFTDKEFRLQQEVEAYKSEIEYLRRMVPDRNKRFKMIQSIAKDLSGFIYGNMCTYQEAMILLK